MTDLITVNPIAFSRSKMEERILTLHPQGKKGVNILKRRYDQIKSVILEVMQKSEELTFQELKKEAGKRLAGKFDGKVTWYVVTVKQDLEARNIIQKVKGPGGQVIKLNKSR